MGGGHGDEATESKPTLLFARDAPIRGRLIEAGGLLVATLSRGGISGGKGRAELGGIGAFDLASGESRWAVWGIPSLAGCGAKAVYGYARTGLAVALGLDGRERWRVSLPDDRSYKARQRGDSQSPFVGDVLADGGTVTLAAGAELFQFSADSGDLLARSSVCQGERAVISRLALAPCGIIVATCTERTDWDDDVSPLEPWLWQPMPRLESLRTGSGDVVACGPDLGQRWRLPPPVPGIVYGDRRPTSTGEAGLVLVGAQAVGNGAGRYLSLFADRIICVDSRTGAVRWQRDMPGGRGHFDPVAIPGGVVAGFEPAFYRLADGTLHWHLSSPRPDVDRTVAPVLDGKRLLFAGHGVIVAADLADGALSIVGRFAKHPFVGSLRSNLLRVGNTLYFGLEEFQQPTQIRGFRL